MIRVRKWNVDAVRLGIFYAEHVHHTYICICCVAAVHVEDIIFHMFQYIQKLRTEGPQAWVFEECKVINVVYFKVTFQTEGRDKVDLLISG